jgi:hypothetical protein
MSLLSKTSWRGYGPLTLAILFFALTAFLQADYAEAKKKRNFGGHSGASVQKRFKGSGGKQKASHNKKVRKKKSHSGFGNGVDSARQGKHQRDRKGQSTANRGDRQTARTERGGQRQEGRSDRGDDRTERAGQRQEGRSDRDEGRTERTEIRQENRTERSETRQKETTKRVEERSKTRRKIADDIADNNYWGHHHGYYDDDWWDDDDNDAAWAFFGGLVLGAVITSLPPRHETVVVEDTTY